MTAAYELSKSSAESGTSRATLLYAVAAGTIATVALLAFMGWLDNLHMNTGNGIYKSIQAEPWRDNFRTAPLDPSNYLYFPLVGILCRGLDALGVHKGEIWRQLAIINSVSAGFVVGITYWLLLRLTSRQAIAVAGTIFHLGSAFVLTLALENEDILPSYTLIFVAMAMAAVWFSAASIWQVISVAVLFTLGWLMEWRLMFPTLPALLLALLVAAVPAWRRLFLIAIFLMSMLATVLCVQQAWTGHPGAIDFVELFWTGKGVGSGWSGFSLDKLSLGVCGMGEYFLGGRNCILDVFESVPRPEWILAIAIELFLLAFLIYFLWRHRWDARWRTAGIVFLGTFAAGEFMNAYSQPADPQMQLNVMPWLTLAATALLGCLPESPRSQRFFGIAALVTALLPLGYNVKSLAALKGRDTQMLEALTDLDRRVDTSRTVFLYAGWEQITAWQFWRWSRHWDGVCDLSAAPLDDPKFKWIDVFAPVIYDRTVTAAQHAAAVVKEIECALSKGYRVVAGPFWSMPEEELGIAMMSLNARAHASAIYDALHDGYKARPIGGPAIVGPAGYSEITRR